MHISAERGFVFVHIPKTGGTSMALALEERAAASDILIGDTPKAKRRRRRHAGVRAAGRLWKHSTLRDIPGLVTDAFVARAFVFTLVRDPWDRALSYHAWLREQAFDHPAVSEARLPFGEFLALPRTRAALAVPYADHVTDRFGRERGTFVRLERLEEDMAPVTARLGFEPRLGRANPSFGRQAHTDATRDLIAEICAGDIARFGYRFRG